MVSLEIAKRLILDSSIIIKHLRNSKEETKLIQELETRARLATTVVNAFEVYYGAYKFGDVRRNLAVVKGFLSTLELLVMDEDSAEIAGQTIVELRSKGQTIDMRDLFIGCIAIRNGFAVLTHNKQHFQKIPKLQVIAPSEF